MDKARSGIVVWNDFSKSWECPIHGSRFNPYGQLLNPPASTNMTHIT